jgi:hypothetical protein
MTALRLSHIEYSFVALRLEMAGGELGIFPLINCCEFRIFFFWDPDPLTHWHSTIHQQNTIFNYTASINAKPVNKVR